MAYSIEKLSSSLIDSTRKAFGKSLYFACRGVFEFSFRGSWLYEPIHRPLCDLLSDPRNRRLAVQLPRDWLKSQICSIYYPLWRAMLEDDFTALVCLNTFKNATKKVRAIGSILQNNPLLRQLYPERMPQKGMKFSEEAIKLPTLSPIPDDTFEAAGCGTQVTSRHHRLIVEDDTVAPEKDRMTAVLMQPSKEEVEKAIGFHKVAHFLLNDFKTDQRLVVGTRWAERDLLSYIEENEKSYKIYKKAAIEYDKDGNEIYLYPTRFDKEVLEEIRRSVGSYMFATLMLNDPQRTDDMIFDINDLRFYESPPPGLLTFISVDPAPPPEETQTDDPDYNVVMTTGVSPRSGEVFVLEYWRKRASPGDVINTILRQAQTYGPICIDVESIAYQSTLKYFLERAMKARGLWFRVEKAMNPRTQKSVKIRGLQPLLENHQLFVMAHHKELIHEFDVFPRGSHDDVIDALAMQQSRWNEVSSMVGEIDSSKGDRFDKFSGDSLIEELHARARPKKGFPNDCLPVGMYGGRLRDDYFWLN